MPKESRLIPKADYPVVRVIKNYKPLVQSTIIKKEVTVGTLLDAHAKLRELGGSAAAGGELAGPWYVYKEGSELKGEITQEQIRVLVDAGAVNREVTVHELIRVGQDFSGGSLKAGGELVGPWYVLKEGTNEFETLGEIVGSG